MSLSAANYDDATILTAWTPPEDRLAIGGSAPALTIAGRASASNASRLSAAPFAARARAMRDGLPASMHGSWDFDPLKLRSASENSPRLG